MKTTTSNAQPAQRSICSCTFWHLLILDNPIRRYLQNPEKILAGRIREGMTVLDIGCGPGIFSRAMATMVGETGTVIAIDLQQEMLDHAQKRATHDPAGSRIIWHQCQPDSLNLTTTADFALSMFMVHEVPDQHRLFSEVYALFRNGGRYLVIEPAMHVSEAAFHYTEKTAIQTGFRVVDRPSFRFSRTLLLER